MRAVRKSKGQAELEVAGFTVHRAFKGGAFRGGLWFDVTDPNGHRAAVLRQSLNCWHWFSKEHEWTASGMSAANCHKGGLGDAIDTDSRMATYQHRLAIIRNRLPKGGSAIPSHPRQSTLSLCSSGKPLILPTWTARRNGSGGRPLTPLSAI